MHKKFIFLISALIIVLPLEILSFFSIHLPFWIEFAADVGVTMVVVLNSLRLYNYGDGLTTSFT